MRTLSKFKPKSEFMRHAVMLMTGTGIAQAIPVAISPILTRIYTPDDFGLFALYMALAGIVSVLATGRYEIAIVMPEKDDDAANIVALSLFCSLVVSVAALALVILFKEPLAAYLKNEKIANWLYFIPVSIVLSSAYQSLYCWVNRKKYYKSMATSKVARSVSTAGVTLGAGLLEGGSIGLLLGYLLGQIAAVATFFRCSLGLRTSFLSSASWSGMRRQAGRYSNFPKFSLAADTLNTAANQIPVILLTQFFGAAVTGFFNLTQRVLGAPLSLLSVSIGDVFKQRASTDFVRTGNCLHIYKKTFWRLFLISAPPFALFAVISPAFFALVFGEEWRVAGDYARIMSVLFFIRFVASPLSYVLYIAEKQKYDLAWQSVLFIVTTISICMGHLFKSAVCSIACFSGVYSAMYLIYLIMSFKFAHGKLPHDETAGIIHDGPEIDCGGIVANKADA